MFLNDNGPIKLCLKVPQMRKCFMHCKILCQFEGDSFKDLKNSNVSLQS